MITRWRGFPPTAVFRRPGVRWRTVFEWSSREEFKSFYVHRLAIWYLNRYFSVVIKKYSKLQKNWLYLPRPPSVGNDVTAKRANSKNVQKNSKIITVNPKGKILISLNRFIWEYLLLFNNHFSTSTSSLLLLTLVFYWRPPYLTNSHQNITVWRFHHICRQTEPRLK